MNALSWNWGLNWRGRLRLLLSLALLAVMPHFAFGQLDQGSITGTVTDPQGAIVAQATVRLTNVDTNLILNTETNGSGIYTFQPIKVGHYSVTVTAPGFATATKKGLDLHAAESLLANLTLKVGDVSENVEVNASAAPLLQTQEASIGQTVSQRQINDMPLSQRNYVFLAQLTAGVTGSNGSRGQGNGDFIANGERATQNNFILDGVDNNSSVIDFSNGASYNVKPPPDALQEFNIQTADSSAEFGHSAGAVVNAQLKSGTNRLNGDVWEYVRNSALGVASPTEWASGVTTPTKVLPYHQNQFGGTIGGPILRNKLFFFFDYEGNRISQSTPKIASVPTALMHSEPGNFTELLNPSLTGLSAPEIVYEPNSNAGSTGTEYLGSSCGNPQNVMCSSQISAIAKNLLLAAYPLPNTGVIGKTYNNYSWSQHVSDKTNQFDFRVDANLSARDQMFVRGSWSHEDRYTTTVLGSIFDGGSGGTFMNYAKSGVFSWNHVFSQNLITQARYAYNWGLADGYQQSYTKDLNPEYGLGGIAAYSPKLGNGGLIGIQINGFPTIGANMFRPSPEGQNTYQIIDDTTWLVGNHSLKFGVNLQNARYSVYQPNYGRGVYNYNGTRTALSSSTYATGYGLADFLADQQTQAWVSNPTPTNNGHWYTGLYLQDAWKLNRRLTVNMGVRYDYFTAPVNSIDAQAEFYPTSATNKPGASGRYLLPTSQKNATLSTVYSNAMAANNITVAYTDNRSLVNSQHVNFAPRLGIAWQVSDRLVVRTGFGLYYSGLENLGNYVNLGVNNPFDTEGNWVATTCLVGNCPGNGIKLATGPAAVSQGLSAPTLTGWDHDIKTSYTMNQNLSVQYAFTNSTAITLAYVGNESRHLSVVVWPDGATALEPPGVSVVPTMAYPAFNNNIHFLSFGGIGNYHSLQATLQRHFNHGLSYSATYTWSHSLDDSREPLPSNGEGGDRMYPVFGLRIDYANSPFNVPQAFTFNGTYELPFGKGRQYLNHNPIVDAFAGGWNSTLVFRTQQGFPFTVSSNTTTVNGATAFPYRAGDPFKGGGSPNSTNPNISCPANVKTREHWYNPCAFADPPLASSITSEVSGAAAIMPYLGSPRSQISGPGFQRIDGSLTKNFPTFENQFLQFRADVYNLFNTPSWNAPSTATTSSVGGLITTNRTFGSYTPDQRFIQLALKYYF
jgi:hypothetical protein